MMENWSIAYWHWLAAGLVLIALEMLVPGFYLLFLGIAALGTGVVVWLLPLSALWQFSLFAVLSIITVVLGRRWYSRQNADTSSGLNRRSAQLVGRKVVLAEAIVNGRGKVNIDDTLWTARGDDLPAGQKVEIVGVSGTEVEVRAL